MSLQSCLTLCNPIDGSPPGSPVPGILQAGTLEWVVISFSNVWKWKVKVKSLSSVRLFVTPWTAAHQAPPSMGFSRQEYWSGVPSPSLDSMAKEDVKIDLFLLLKFHLFSLFPSPKCGQMHSHWKEKGWIFMAKLIHMAKPDQQYSWTKSIHSGPWPAICECQIKWLDGFLLHY